jgi:pseudaminic acid synthase
MKIANRTIGQNHSPFIIAEMSGNHNQSLDRALQIVEAAVSSGAHAIKLQTFTADTLTLDISERAFCIDDENSPWHGKNLHALYKQAQTPWKWHKPIMERANELGIICFSSPFDETAVEFLEELNVPAYKIASFENTHIPLIQKAASTGKPLIISTGMASEEELFEAVEAARDSGCSDLLLLKCTSTYPASPEDSNVITIPDMKTKFGCEVGLSDHTMGFGTSIAAIAHGATVIEKHLTLSREDEGVDSKFSMEPEELRQLVIETERAWQSLGKVTYGPTDAEQKSLLFRRSIYIASDMKKGDVFTTENLSIIRPGNGLAPKHLQKLLGKQANQDIKRGTPAWNRCFELEE